MQSKPMLLETACGYLDKELLLALRNVVVERRLANAELVCDVLHRYGAVAALVKQGLRRVKEPLSGVADCVKVVHGSRSFALVFVYLLIGR